MPVLTRARYHWLDALRGAAVVNMVLFHFLYDWYVVYGRQPGWYWLGPVRLWQQLICCTFILVAGFSARLGRRTLRHGVLLNLCGLGVSAVTLLATPGQAVRFGILNLLGCAMLLCWALRPVLQRLPAPLGLGLNLGLFVLLRHVPEGYVSLGPFWRMDLPAGLYRWRALAFLGLPGPGFASSDYFALIPWCFLFFAGWFLCGLAKPRFGGALGQLQLPMLEYLGRHSLAVYLLHQPLCMLVCMAFAL